MSPLRTQRPSGFKTVSNISTGYGEISQVSMYVESFVSTSWKNGSKVLRKTSLKHVQTVPLSWRLSWLEPFPQTNFQVLEHCIKTQFLYFEASSYYREFVFLGQFCGRSSLLSNSQIKSCELNGDGLRLSTTKAITKGIISRQPIHIAKHTCVAAFGMLIQSSNMTNPTVAKMNCDCGFTSGERNRGTVLTVTFCQSL